MANRPALVKQADLTRIAKAMQAAGVAEWRVECKAGGDYVIVAGKTDQANQKSDWD